MKPRDCAATLHQAPSAVVSEQGEFRVPEQSAGLAERQLPGRVTEPVDLGSPPPAVVAAAALGAAPSALLAIYAVLFLLRATLAPAVEPDVTSSRLGEGVVGGVIVVATVLMSVAVARLVSGRGSKLFIALSVLVAVGCGLLVADRSSGGAQVSVTMGLVSLLAAALALTPPSRRWLRAHAAERASQRSVDQSQPTHRRNSGLANDSVAP